MLRLGIIGLPNVGKTTLFNALTKAGAAAANYPFCTVDSNVGVVAVPDERLDRLTDAVTPPKPKVPATVEFVDIAGLVEGASRGEGLGNQFLSHIRGVDAIVHVVRCFEDPDVTHVVGAIDARRDHDLITTELALADLAVVERRLEKSRKTVRSGDKEHAEEVTFLERVEAELSAGRGARGTAVTLSEVATLRQLGILTARPILYAANVDESELASGGGPAVEVLTTAVREHHEDATVLIFSARFEAELAELSDSERREFLESVGIDTPGLERLIRAGYELLGLETFFTIGENEVRAWTIPRSTTAFDAAGVIHSDFQQGFIRAETVHIDDFLRVGSWVAARDQGLLRSEGRDYIVQDGEILLFRFSR